MPVSELVILLVLCHVKYAMVSLMDECERNWDAPAAGVWGAKIMKLHECVPEFEYFLDVDTKAELEGKLDELEQDLIAADEPFGPVGDRRFHMRLV